MLTYINCYKSPVTPDGRMTTCPRRRFDRSDKMEIWDALCLVEGLDGLTGFHVEQRTLRVAVQLLISSGQIMVAPGSITRACINMIARGWCRPPTEYLRGHPPRQ